MDRACSHGRTEVEGMLPEVDAQERGETKQRILVGGRHGLEALRGRVVSEPGPAGALDAKGSSVDCLLEGVERAKVGLDGVSESARLGELGLVDLRE